ncbi:hypothetical protein JCM6882_005144 [Rhodosporidiobolus microsporus]
MADEMNFSEYSIYGEGVHGAVIASWIAIMRPEKVTSLLLASPGYMSEPPHVVEMLRGVMAELLVNKETGPGDRSGTLPPGPLEDITAYFIGSSERLAQHRVVLSQWFQKRYGTGHSAHDIKWLFQAVYDRKPIPHDQLASIKCPVLILRGGDDKIVCPESACQEWQNHFVSAKGGAAIHAISSAPSRISLSDSNIVNRILMQFVQRAVTSK